MPLWIDLFTSKISQYLCLIPYRVLWFFASLLSVVLFEGFHFRRWTVLKNITIAFPQKTHSERMELASRGMKNQAYMFLEFMRLPGMSKDFVKKEFTFHGVEHFQRMQNQGKGALLMSLHIGSGDIGINALALEGFKISVISKKFKNKFANDFWFGFRERNGVSFIDPHGPKTAFDIFSCLKKNRGVVFVIDQFMGQPFGIETQFFGRKTGTAYGLALFSAKTKLPVIPLYTYRDLTGHTHICFDQPLPVIDAETRDLQMQQMTESYNRRLEEIIRNHPEQWMWIHRRWKKFE